MSKKWDAKPWSKADFAMIARLPKGELPESRRKCFSSAHGRGEKLYLLSFSSRSKNQKPEKFIKLFNKKMNTFLKSGS